MVLHHIPGWERMAEALMVLGRMAVMEATAVLVGLDQHTVAMGEWGMAAMVVAWDTEGWAWATVAMEAAWACSPRILTPKNKLQEGTDHCYDVP